MAETLTIRIFETCATGRGPYAKGVCTLPKEEAEWLILHKLGEQTTQTTDANADRGRDTLREITRPKLREKATK